VLELGAYYVKQSSGVVLKVLLLWLKQRLIVLGFSKGHGVRAFSTRLKTAGSPMAYNQ
jgi:hypothetical protein